MADNSNVPAAEEQAEPPKQPIGIKRGSVRSAVVRLRSSVRKNFGRMSLNRSRRKQMRPQSMMLPPTQDENVETETFRYRGSVKDAARRFVNISRHKAQETFDAAKYIIKKKKKESCSSEEGDDGFLDDYCFSFSDSEDVFGSYIPEEEQKIENIFKNCDEDVTDF